jgi:hypothetical protein
MNNEDLDSPIARNLTPGREAAADGRSSHGAEIDHPAASLRSVLVEYPERCDRRTVCPKGLERHELMVSWLTADDADFVDLGEYR